VTLPDASSGYRVLTARARAVPAALVAAVAVLVAVVSDAAAVPRAGFSPRPATTVLVTVSGPADPRAVEGPAPQDRHRVLS